MAKVTYVHPAFVDGEGFTIPGLNAVLLNNEAVDIDQEVIDEYESRTGNTFADVSKGPNFTGKFPTDEEAAIASNPDIPPEVLFPPEPTLEEAPAPEAPPAPKNNKTTTEGGDS